MNMITPPPFRDNRWLQVLVGYMCLFWIATAIAPYNRFDWLLENLLVFVYGVILIVTYRYFKFTNTTYTLFAIFLTLHLAGAHYTYSETPLGYWLMDIFGFQRNHYDRIVHFSYGLLLAYPIWELIMRLARTTPRWAYFLTVNTILAFSGFFEIIEAWIAMLVSPELGDAYLGTQGDTWDAQRDMSLAFVGGVIAMIITHVMTRGRSF